MNKKFLLIVILLLIAGFSVNSYLMSAKDNKMTDATVAEEQTDKMMA